MATLLLDPLDCNHERAWRQSVLVQRGRFPIVQDLAIVCLKCGAHELARLPEVA